MPYTSFYDEQDKYFKLVDTHNARIEKLEADLLREKKRTMALILCLRNFIKASPGHLPATFEFYLKDFQHENLENSENIQAPS